MEAIEKANKILHEISKYMSSNQLHINLDKCCYMHFAPPSKHKHDNEIDNEVTHITINNHVMDMFFRYSKKCTF